MDYSQYGIDKSLTFMETYEKIFDEFVEKPDVALLELGVKDGNSLRLWSDMLGNRATVVGIDVSVNSALSNKYPNDNVYLVAGNQENKETLNTALSYVPYGVFDIIIDDCSHQGLLARKSFCHLFPHLSPGGYYVIEDWGTGYWSSWPDGKSPSPLKPIVPVSTEAYELDDCWVRIPSHDYGMVGFVKELIDEAGRADATKFQGSQELSMFESMTIKEGLVVIKKRS